MTDKIIIDLYEDVYDRLHLFESGLEQKRQIIHDNEAEITKIIGEDKFLKIDELIGAEISASERYAFVTGFKYAMQLALACGGNKPPRAAERK